MRVKQRAPLGAACHSSGTSSGVASRAIGFSNSSGIGRTRILVACQSATAPLIAITTRSCGTKRSKSSTVNS